MVGQMRRTECVYRHSTSNGNRVPGPGTGTLPAYKRTRNHQRTLALHPKLWKGCISEGFTCITSIYHTPLSLVQRFWRLRRMLNFNQSVLPRVVCSGDGAMHETLDIATRVRGTLKNESKVEAFESMARHACDRDVLSNQIRCNLDRAYIHKGCCPSTLGQWYVAPSCLPRHTHTHTPRPTTHQQSILFDNRLLQVDVRNHTLQQPHEGCVHRMEQRRAFGYRAYTPRTGTHHLAEPSLRLCHPLCNGKFRNGTNGTGTVE